MFSRAIPAVRRVLAQGAAASVRTSSAQFQRVVASSVRPTVQVATFSAEIIPGYGKGKTSTGIVSFSLGLLGLDHLETLCSLSHSLEH
jgi:hypothetical protein